MSYGPCRLCKECTLTAPRRHGYEARPSMEASDILQGARGNGFPIEVAKTREEERNILGLILVE